MSLKFLNSVDISTGVLETNSNFFQLNTPSGYIQIGAMNTDHAHIYTDRADFYFNKNINVNGAFALTAITGVGLSGNQTIGGTKTFSGTPVFRGATYWRVSSSDAALQRADARDDLTNFSRLHWYGNDASGNTSNFRHAWYDGSSYIDVTATGGAVVFTGELEATALDINGSANISGNLEVGGAGSFTGNTTFTADVYVHHNDGLQIGDTGNSSTARTTLTSFASGGNSKMRIKGGNFVHQVDFETSKNSFRYANLKSSYNGGTSDLNLYQSNSDTTGTAATTTISTGTSTFAGNVTAGSNSLTAGSLDINGSADISGNLHSQGIIYQSSTSGGGFYAPMVKNGAKLGGSSTTTGRLRIKIPHYGGNGMQSFIIDIYEYNTDRMQSIIVGGYNYEDYNWYNTSAIALMDSDNRDLTVRFGKDTSASANYVAVGETNTTWTYPQVVVRNYMSGHSTQSAEFLNPFTIEFVTTDNASYNATHNDNQPMANWGKIEGIPSTFPPNTSITDSISTTSSTTRASATAAKAAYDRGSTGVSNAASAQTTANAALPKAGGTMTGDITTNDNVEVKFGTGADVRMGFNGSDLVTTVPVGSSFLIGTNGGTPNDNNGNADFVVDVNSSPQISFYSNQVQIGGTNMNWNAFLRYDGSTKLGGWDNDIQIFQQGGAGSSAKNIFIRPQAAGGSTTTVATFNGDTGTTLTGNASVSGNLAVIGDLNVTGDINSVSVTDLDITDKTITIAKGSADSSAADGAGIIVDGASASLLYDHTGTQWEFNKTVEFNGDLLPSSDAVHTLGQGGKRWNYAYINNTLTVTDGNINSSNEFDFNQGGDFAGNLTLSGDTRTLNLATGTTSSQSRLIIGEQSNYGVAFRWDSSASLQFDGFWATSIAGNRNRDLGSINVDTRTWYLKNNVEVSGELQAASLDINGVANISDHLVVKGTTSSPFSSLFAGSLVVQGAASEDPIIAVTDVNTANAAAGVFHQSSASPGFPALVINAHSNGNEQPLISARTNVSNTTGTGGTEVFKVDGDGDATFKGNIALTGGGTIEAPSVNGSETLNLIAAGGINLEIDSNGNSGDNQFFNIYKHSIGGTALFSVKETGEATFSDVIKTANGGAGTPAYNFTSHDGNGMYLEDYDASNNKEQVSVSTDGTRRLRVNEAGVWSDQNFYVSGDWRTFSSVWDASAGTSGAGFRFQNTHADTSGVVALTISATGNGVFAGSVTANGVTLTGNQDLSSYITQTNADARYVLETGGTSSAMTGDLHIISGAPKLFLQDNTDDDDQAIIFRNASNGDDYKIQTQDFTSAATGDGLFIGSEGSDPVKLVTNDTIALTLDTSQNATFGGTVTHAGLNPSAGTAIDQLSTFNMSFQLAANTWTDTGIDGADLLSGTYAMQVYVEDFNAGGGHFYEFYSATISWYQSNTNSTNHDEIVLHRAGHASNASHLQFRTLRASNSDSHDLMLQVKQNFGHNTALTGASGKQMVIKFRKLI